QPAFTGNTTAVIFHAILERTPASVLSLNPKLPPKLDEIVGKALEKDREVRYQTASDLRADLRRLKRDTESGRSAAAAAASRVAEVARPSVPLQRRWLVAAASLALLVASLVGLKLGWFTRFRPQSQPEITQRQITANPTEDAVIRAVISPDGKY